MYTSGERSPQPNALLLHKQETKRKMNVKPKGNKTMKQLEKIKQMNEPKELKKRDKHAATLCIYT